MRLTQGSRVVIVGGGPAGSFTALHLLRFAAEANLQLEITIFEARDFNRPGPGGCNKCAGVVSSTLLRNLSRLDLALPPDIIQSELSAYVLHLNGNKLIIQQPDPEHRIVSVYRGSGPRLAPPPYPGSFDGWLLGQAQSRGAVLQRERVRTVRKGPRPTVVTARQELEADLVVVASGANSRPPLEAAWGYRSPRTEIMAQDEIPWPAGLSSSHVHIFFEPPQGLIFGGLIPKGPYANVSLLGRKLPPEAIAEFLEGHNLSMQTPPIVPALCGCTPRVAVSPAGGYYANRMVAVGDAAVTRLYKDGLGAAFITAEAAARTAIKHGIGRNNFAAGYCPTCRRIAMDNHYGKILFRLWTFTRRSPVLTSAWERAILQESHLPAAQQIHRRALWAMFTGDESYQRTFWLVSSPSAAWGLWRSTIRARR